MATVQLEMGETKNPRIFLNISKYLAIQNFSPVWSILRHGKTAMCHFEGGTMEAGKRRGVEVMGRDLRLQRSAREMDLDPFQNKKDPFQFNFQMSFDGTGCFHWCVGRSAEECTLTRFLSSQLTHVVHVVTSPRVL